MCQSIPNDVLSIRLGGENDVELVMFLVRRCIADMRQAGIDQWDDVYPNEATLLSDARAGTLYLAFLDAGPPVGAVVLNDYQNPEYAQVPWTIDGMRVAVVHRLMVDPRYQRKGIARELMRFAEHLAVARGYDAVRLDAFSANPGSLRLYQSLGYHDAGCATFRKGVFRAFEKRLVMPEGR